MPDVASASSYGVAGDRLWVRETWKPDDRLKGGGIPRLGITFGEGVQWRCGNPDQTGPWKSPYHMRRIFSRITLEILKVRVERLQDISEKDAIAEGIEPTMSGYGSGKFYRDYLCDAGCCEDPRNSYKTLWDSLHKERDKGSQWCDNPFVWVLNLKVLK